MFQNGLIYLLSTPTPNLSEQIILTCCTLYEHKNSTTWNSFTILAVCYALNLEFFCLRQACLYSFCSCDRSLSVVLIFTIVVDYLFIFYFAHGTNRIFSFQSVWETLWIFQSVWFDENSPIYYSPSIIPGSSIVLDLQSCAHDNTIIVRYTLVQCGKRQKNYRWTSWPCVILLRCLHIKVFLHRHNAHKLRKTSESSPCEWVEKQKVEVARRGEFSHYLNIS